MTEADFIHAFWKTSGCTYNKLSLIEGKFGCFSYAWERASKAELNFLDEQFVENICKTRRELNIENERQKLWEKDIFLVHRDSKEFPDDLKHIDKSPFMLYRKGARLDSYGLLVAIVGMRKSSILGEKNAFNLTKSLSIRGVQVVSGLAFGIDGAAQAGAVFSKVPTIGVLASGIDKITPGSHTDLAKKILECGGTIVSEYPETADGMKYRFVERNRIISGLAKAVVIVEADIKSGALITAKYALEQGREVLAFPGDAGKIQSRGCNQLIKKGEAQLIENYKDILNAIGRSETDNDQILKELLMGIN